MIDTHAHIELCEGEPAEVVAAATAVGVDRIMTIGLDPASSQRAVELSEQFEQVYAAVGCHPCSAAELTQEGLDQIAELAAHPRCLAIGETGFDYYHEQETKRQQRSAFEAQIEIARAVGKPLVIHNREASEDTVQLLEEKASGLSVLIHCFSMTEHVERCIENGWWTSFAGNLTYPKAENLREAAVKLPIERLLVETDAPYLTPQPMRGKRNQPANVVHTAELLAELHGVTYSKFYEQLASNATELLKW